ncbi:MAG TPA: hypothetical protein VH639_15275 [Bryobacteraceae bacterium]
MATSVWRGYITFGLVSIPVRLVRAARAERVKLRQVYGAPAEPEFEPEDDSAKGRVAAAPVRPGPVLAERTATPPPPIERPSALAPVRRVATNDAGAAIPKSDVGKGYEVRKANSLRLTRRN